MKTYFCFRHVHDVLVSFHAFKDRLAFSIDYFRLSTARDYEKRVAKDVKLENFNLMTNFNKQKHKNYFKIDFV